MSKYKVGDKVFIVYPPLPNGAIRDSEWVRIFPNHSLMVIYDYLGDCSYSSAYSGVYNIAEEYLVPEAVYNSRVFKALNELE